MKLEPIPGMPFPPPGVLDQIIRHNEATDPRSWPRKFLSLVLTVADWSKDRSRKTACIIAGPAHDVRAMGYNGFPRGVDDDVVARHERPAKYHWTEHAERNAIYNAARSGVALENCTAYMHWYPCADCARALVQAGISTIWCVEPEWDDETYKDSFAVVPVMFQEAGVEVRYYENVAPPKRR